MIPSINNEIKNYIMLRRLEIEDQLNKAYNKSYKNGLINESIFLNGLYKADNMVKYINNYRERIISQYTNKKVNNVESKHMKNVFNEMAQRINR